MRGERLKRAAQTAEHVISNAAPRSGGRAEGEAYTPEAGLSSACAVVHSAEQLGAFCDCACTTSSDPVGLVIPTCVVDTRQSPIASMQARLRYAFEDIGAANTYASEPGFAPVKVGGYYRSIARGRYDMWVGSIEPHPTSPKGAANPTHFSLGPTASPLGAPPVGTRSTMSRRSCFMRCICVRQWAGPSAAPTVEEGGAGAAPDCVIVFL